MARLRLLVGLAVALSATSMGCQLPNWRPEIRGTVLDKRSGTPVVGAVVFATWWVSVVGGSDHPVETLWATTDEQGQFLLPTTSHGFGVLGYYAECPGYLVVHRDYGTGGAPRLANPREVNPPPLCYNPVIEIEPNPITIQTLQNPREWPWLCRGLTNAACSYACETFYGTKNVCR